ncbi:o-succinylbenzoate synthase [Bacillus smithii]|uniref:o-succinylbenzoate synthase n=1 Tax=Bacillus smithii TaxID=1479 RepID=UPI0022E8B472|nr:o-succinylbenzoate synthase [Bacillus smithii]
MIIEKISMRHMKMKMKLPFVTSFGTIQMKDFILVEVQDESGNIGWGESVAFSAPTYTEETFQTNRHILEDFLIPLIKGREISHPHEVNSIFQPIRGNYMAKSAIETAIWDLYAKRLNKPLYQVIGGKKRQIEVGISLGIQKSIDDLLEMIKNYVEQGYKRVKVKIKPGWDVEVIRQIRHYFPQLPLMADANSAYRLEDVPLLKQLDDFHLMMIEQPLAHDDIVDHALVQKELKTPICLDESIHSLEDVRKAVELGSCQIINLKIGRVGGLGESIKIHDFCKEHHIPLWCGGMLEAGIGRAHNVAITTLDQFTLPGDTAASSHYWERDIIQPEVTVENGWIHVPEKPGIGYEPDFEAIDSFTCHQKVF